MKLKSFIAASATCAILAGCTARSNEYVYRLNNGAAVVDFEAFETAKTACIGRSESAGLSAGPVYSDNAVNDIMNGVERENAKDAVVKGCMAASGYRLTQLPPGMTSR